MPACFTLRVYRRAQSVQQIEAGAYHSCVMNIHRNWKVFLRGPGCLVLAIVCWFAPQLLAAVGYQLVFGDWVAYGGAVICVLAGIVFIVSSFRAYALRIDDSGVTWTNGPKTVTFAWADVSRAAIEQKPNSSKKDKPSLLTIYTASTVQYPVEPNVKLEGLNGYRVADINDIREPVTELTAALRTYAGNRYAEAAS
jgi:hypothetical protein